MIFVMLFVMLISSFADVSCFGGLFDNFDRPTKLEFDNSKFILILLDGFASAYFNITRLNAFDHIKQNGVHAEYMIPQFPSISYPNYFSILTGRYVEDHNVALNFLYNQQTKQKFNLLDTSAGIWWNMSDPMWTSTTKAGLRTRVYLWPGCEIPVNGTLPEYCLNYSTKIWTNVLQHHLKDIVQRFSRNETDVGFVYCEQPDLFGHIFGPSSFIVRATVRSLNDVLQGFLEDLDSKGIQNKVNFIIVSDHGMTHVGRPSAQKVSLSRFISDDDVEAVLDHGAIVGIHPEPGKSDKVYNSLKEVPGMHVWKKDEIPDKFKFKHAVTSPPILMLAKKGYYLNGLPNSKKQQPAIPFIGMGLVDAVLQGYHGYDPEEVSEMYGIFLAMGPAFKKGFQLPPIFNKDVYNLAMHAIGIPPLANAGNWDLVKSALREP